MLRRIRQFFATDRKSLAAPDSESLALFGASTTTAAGVSVGPGSALAVPAVTCAVRAIAEACATLDAKVMRGTEEVRDHPVEGLLRGEVNDWTDGFTFLRDLVAQALIYDAGGLAWVNKLGGRPVEILHYQPGHLMAEYDPHGTGEPTYRLQGQLLASDSVIHLRSPFGRAPVSLAREAIGLSLTLERHAAKLFGKDGRPNAMVSYKDRLAPEAVKNNAAAFTAMLNSDKTSGIAHLDNGATYQSITMTSVDGQFIELTGFQVLQVARSFRVPPQMLYDLTRATWSNAEQMGREFLTYTLEPWLRALEGALRRTLFTPEERAAGFRVLFDRDDLTRADIGARATAYSTLIASRVLSPNEARGWEGLPPYEGGDTFANPNTGANQAGAAAPQEDGGRPAEGEEQP
ncbi:phage portal protein [Xanthobacter sediminis]